MAPLSAFVLYELVEHPQLPLSFAYQMRNAIAHGYFKVDFEIVWRTIHLDLPGLYKQVLELVENLPCDGNSCGHTREHIAK